MARVSLPGSGAILRAGLARVSRLAAAGQVEAGRKPAAGEIAAQVGQDEAQRLAGRVGGREKFQSHTAGADLCAHQDRPQVVWSHAD
jgi:NADPH-dependent curcumin reductase CurA